MVPGVIIALASAILFGACGDILLSRGMRTSDEIKVRYFSEIPVLIAHVFKRPLILLGVLSMAIYFGSYMTALIWVDVSVANPLTALSYLMATLYAIFMLRERVNKLRWMGIVIITFGAILVGLSS